MRRSLTTSALVVLAATLALGVAAQVPVNDDPTTLKESQCYPCHSDSTNGPPIATMYIAEGAGEVTIPLGEKALVEVAVENGWVAELTEIAGIMDLEGAPGLKFASELEPETLLFKGTFEAQATLGQRIQEQTFTVLPGTTDLVITLEPDPDAGTTVPSDLALHIRPPGVSDAEAIHVDNAGIGEPETFELHGIQDIETLGTGVWTAEVVLDSPQENPTTPLEHPYQMTVATDFRGTDVTFQYVNLDDRLPSNRERPGDRLYLPWLLYADSLPTAPMTIPVEVIVVAHYDHAPNHSSYDDWRFTQTIELNIIPDAQTNAITVRPDGAGPPPLPPGGFSWAILSEVVGYLSATLVIASIYTGGMFGKASRRQLNAVFGTAKRRVAFHNFLSYGIVAAAVAHMVIFFAEPAFDWTLGLIWGGISILAMLGLGLTGALQVPMIRKWNYGLWRWSHFYLAIGTIVFTIVHIFLDGVHFAGLQETLGWSNPFTRA